MCVNVGVCTRPPQTDFHSTSSCKLCWQRDFVSVLNEISNENSKLISAVLGIFVSQGINGGECMDILSVFDAQSKKCFHKSLKLNSK